MNKALTILLLAFTISSFGQTSSTKKIEFLNLYTIDLTQVIETKDGISDTYFYLWLRNQEYSAIVDSRMLRISTKKEMELLLSDLTSAYTKMKVKGGESFRYKRDKYTIKTSYKYITIYVEDSIGISGYTNVGDYWMTKELSKLIEAVKEAVKVL